MSYERKKLINMIFDETKEIKTPINLKKHCLRLELQTGMNSRSIFELISEWSNAGLVGKIDLRSVKTENGLVFDDYLIPMETGASRVSD